MRLWFAPGSEVTLHRQLRTQVVLAILSGDLQAGQKLPSTRALARRFHIHPNTVSSAYQHLEEENWVESRRGSGVFVKERKLQPLTPEQMLDLHIADFLRAVRRLGLPAHTVQAQLAHWLAAPPVDHLLLIEADNTVAQILMTELLRLTSLPVKLIAPDACRADPAHLAGAIPLCRPSCKLLVQKSIGLGTELTVLPINSAVTQLAPLVGAAPGHLIAIVSHWPEFLETARTMLLAAGVSGDALVLVNAGETAWAGRLLSANAILCDAYTATRPELPQKPRRFVFPLLAASTKQLLAQALPSPAAAVTPAKVS